MMRSTFAARFLLLSMLIVGWNASTAMAAEAPPVLVSAGRHLLEWTPVVDFESITLSLADPQGLVRVRRFGPGEAPVLSLFDVQGMPLPDGTYTWELRVTPRRSAGRPVAPLVQSGYFTISNGHLVAPDLSEPSERVITSEDQMVPDDLIVDGKGCIGLGCANNEAFFSEALRLKQSVVRLRFEDTSVAAGLPTRDWQLTVNDAASGGADRFSIDDLTAGTTPFTVRGGAPSNSLYVNGVGNVGLGTATPSKPLHMVRNDGTAQILVQETTAPAAIRSLIQIENNGGTQIALRDTSAFGGAGVTWVLQNVNAQVRITDVGDAVNEFTVTQTGDVMIPGNLTAANFPSSSRKLKQDFTSVEPGAILANLVRMPITEWTFKEDPEQRRHIGPTVEDFSATFGLGTYGQSLVVTDVNGVALAAIQGLHSLVEEQRQLIERQQEVIGRLEERLRRLEAQRSTED